MKFLYYINICCLVLIASNGYAQIEQEKKTKKKVLAKFGMTLINSITRLSTDDNFIRSIRYSSGNISTSKHSPLPPSQIGVTFSIEIPIYKNIHAFTSPTFNKYTYSIALRPPTEVSVILGTHHIKQYHIPIQLLYVYRLGKSNVHIVPKLGLTLTSHSEGAEPFSHQQQTLINSDTILDISYFNASAESSTVNKLIPSLSGGLALKFGKPEKSNLEIGLSAIYKIKNPEAKYTTNRIDYNGADNSVISDKTEHLSFSTKNSTIQFYITWYPKFLRVTKKVK